MEPQADPSRLIDAWLPSAPNAVIALDYDGTLAPIVDDPAVAAIHPDAADLLVDLAAEVGVVAVVTGRPARQVLALGGLDLIGERIGALGREFVVLGQYGNERWTSSHPRVVTPKPPVGIATLTADLPRIFRRVGITDAFVEEKGLAVAVHTRRSAEPAATYAALLPALSDAAAERGLMVEPGRFVIEVRAPGMDKGIAVRGLLDQVGSAAGGLMVFGDDRGDIPAFAVVAQERVAGRAALAVCAGSPEEPALVERADLVVPGPDGVLDFLTLLRDALRR